MNPLETFIERTKGLSYKPKSIFPSEMFLFYNEALKVDPDLIIESGVGYGGSTRYLTKLFPDEPRIIAFDDARYSQPGVQSRLRWRVEFMAGDSRQLMPDFVDSVSAKRIVILIDGPKGESAVDLARRMLARDRVVFVAVHDLPYALPGRYACQSHRVEFRQAFGFLDKGLPPYQLRKQPQGPGLTIFDRADETNA